ncbi:hypothetical protein SESBI_07562 [Sesbania bispinosa]|nr:hypothetical protein SESBI_07562 [Sesbania bispinosa]
MAVNGHNRPIAAKRPGSSTLQSHCRAVGLYHATIAPENNIIDDVAAKYPTSLTCASFKAYQVIVALPTYIPSTR